MTLYVGNIGFYPSTHFNQYYEHIWLSLNLMRGILGTHKQTF